MLRGTHRVPLGALGRVPKTSVACCTASGFVVRYCLPPITLRPTRLTQHKRNCRASSHPRVGAVVRTCAAGPCLRATADAAREESTRRQGEGRGRRLLDLQQPAESL